MANGTQLLKSINIATHTLERAVSSFAILFVRNEISFTSLS